MRSALFLICFFPWLCRRNVFVWMPWIVEGFWKSPVMHYFCLSWNMLRLSGPYLVFWLCPACYYPQCLHQSKAVPMETRTHSSRATHAAVLAKGGWDIGHCNAGRKAVKAISGGGDPFPSPDAVLRSTSSQRPHYHSKLSNPLARTIIHEYCYRVLFAIATRCTCSARSIFLTCRCPAFDWLKKCRKRPWIPFRS